MNEKYIAIPVNQRHCLKARYITEKCATIELKGCFIREPPIGGPSLDQSIQYSEALVNSRVQLVSSLAHQYSGLMDLYIEFLRADDAPTQHGHQ